MILILIIISYLILLIFCLNNRENKVLTLNLLAIIVPWILYFSLIFIFKIKFDNFNPDIFLFILLLSFLSFFSCIAGYNLSKKKNLINNTSPEKTNFLEFYVLFLTLGIIGSIATIIGRTEALHSFLNYSSLNELYKLRYTANLQDTGFRIESKFEYLKIFLPFSFISVVPISCNKKIKVLRYLALILFLTGGMMVAARFNFLFLFLSLLITAYMRDKNIFRIRNVILIILFFYLLAISFDMRSPDDDTLYFYKKLGGINNIGFIGGQKIENSIFIKPIYNMVIYFVHSANYLALFIEDFKFREFTHGSYQFSILINIINSLFDSSILTKNNYFIEDKTLGIFTTYIRDLYADFGYGGCLIFSLISGYLLGYLSYIENHKWYYKILYHYTLILFILSPQILLLTDYILLMYLFLFLFISFKINFKFN